MPPVVVKGTTATSLADQTQAPHSTLLMPFQSPDVPSFLAFKYVHLTRLHGDDDPLAIEGERGDDSAVGGRHLGREESTGSGEPGLRGLIGVLEVGFVGRWWWW